MKDLFPELTLCILIIMCDQYLFAGDGDASIWIPDLVALIQYNIVPVVAL